MYNADYNSVVPVYRISNLSFIGRFYYPLYSAVDVIQICLPNFLDSPSLLQYKIQMDISKCLLIIQIFSKDF